MDKWTTANMPDETGRVAVMTGAGGLGFETAMALASAGAVTVIAGRDETKGAEAVARIKASHPNASARFEMLDLADLKSVRAFAARLEGTETRLDILINNAGVMVPPQRRETADGFELQFGTNHVGHFALTGRLLALLTATAKSRVISLSSVAARSGQINFDDLNAERGYVAMREYSQSKLACLMFGLELQRRSEAGGWGLTSLVAHPGVSRTDLLHNAPGKRSVMGLTRSLLWFLFQPAAQGALPTLFAATCPNVEPGGYYGPDRLGETRGHPAPAKVPPAALDQRAARRLWDASAEMVGGFAS